MPFLIALFFCLMNFMPASFAAEEALPKTQADPVLHTTNAAAIPENKAPIAPLGGGCRFPYYCNSTKQGAVLKCVPGSLTYGEQDCGEITLWCASIDEARTAKRSIEESDQKKYVRLCTEIEPDLR